MVVVERVERALVGQAQMGCEFRGRGRRRNVDGIVVVARVVAGRQVISCCGESRHRQEAPKVDAHGESADKGYAMCSQLQS